MNQLRTIAEYLSHLGTLSGLPAGFMIAIVFQLTLSTATMTWVPKSDPG